MKSWPAKVAGTKTGEEARGVAGLPLLALTMMPATAPNVIKASGTAIRDVLLHKRNQDRNSPAGSRSHGPGRGGHGRWPVFAWDAVAGPGDRGVNGRPGHGEVSRPGLRGTSPSNSKPGTGCSLSAKSHR